MPQIAQKINAIWNWAAMLHSESATHKYEVTCLHLAHDEASKEISDCNIVSLYIVQRVQVCAKLHVANVTAVGGACGGGNAK